MTIDLSSKVALVTGGSRGIGLAIAERLHAAGTHTAILGRDADRACAAAAGLAGRGRTLAVTADVGKSAEVETALTRVEQELGPVDILVNNAGFTRDGLLVRMSEQDWDDVMNVNLKGAFNTMRLVARTMIKRRWGRIINITSIVGLAGNRGQANYTAAKAGLVGLTKAMAKELASRNVLVNAVAPGFVDTDLTRDLSDDQRKVLLEQIPQGRLGQASDVAGAVLFLASDLADYITGQVVVVSGGMVM
jgi:3-oxoacyl-[acyl-carrier protein] reductase